MPLKQNVDAVITGMGVVTPVGTGLTEFWNSLLQKRSGIGVRESLAATDFPFRIGGFVRNFDGKQFVKPRKSLKVMCPQIQFGYAAAQMAAEQANVAAGTLDPDRLGTMFASETFYADPGEVASVFRKCVVNRSYDHDRWGEFAMREIMPLWMLKYLPNMVASHISIACDARGPSNSICQGEVSGHLAIIEAIDLIERGAADAVIVGGTGSPMELTATLYRGWRMLSRRTHDPTTAMRPFDRNRDGVVLGEGAGAIVLERGSHAAARGARPLARLIAYDRSFRDPRSPKFDAAITRSLTTVLEGAGRAVHDLAFASAHARSDPQWDAIEARGIAAAVGELPVYAPKSYFGDLGPGSSIVELIGGVLALREQILPGTMNLDDLDPACPVNADVEARRLSGPPAAILTSHATTGQIASLIVEAA